MFMISDLPPQMPVSEVRMFCSVEAAVHYQIPADLIYAVSLNEGGDFKSKSPNNNGTFDLGIMQFNTSFLKTLESEGIKPEHVMNASCYAFHLAAWRIKGHLQENDHADVFTMVAYYHSRTPRYNQIYKKRLISNLRLFDRNLGNFYFDLIMERLKAGVSELR